MSNPKITVEVKFSLSVEDHLAAIRGLVEMSENLKHEKLAAHFREQAKQMSEALKFRATLLSIPPTESAE